MIGLLDGNTQSTESGDQASDLTQVFEPNQMLSCELLVLS